jgi:hypothetical protein
MKICLTNLFVLVCLVLSGRRLDASENLIANGDFEASTRSPGKPDHWGLKEATGQYWLEEESGNHFLRLKVTEPGKMNLVYREIYFDPEDSGKALQLRLKIRCDGLEPGARPWYDGRIFVNFKDAKGNKLKSPGVPYVKGTRKEWAEKTIQMKVPEGANRLEIMPVLFQAQAGSVDFDDLELAWIDRLVEKPKTRAQTASFPTKGGKPYPPMLKVKGNRLVDSAGQEHWLQGVSIPSLEWSRTGDYIHNSVVIAIEEWNANCIRLPVHSKFWFGTSGWEDDGGKQYRKLVDKLVEATASRGAYLVLDLHEYKAIQPLHVKFWLDAASRYKNHPAVLFGLLNEPHSITWDHWKYGGEIKEKAKAKAGVAAENTITYSTFQSPGMQACLDAVRQTGAGNICVIGALDWAYDLSGILKGYDIKDPNGNGVMYDTHVYPWKSDWQSKFLDIAARHPILLGENGCDTKRMAWETNPESPYTWAPDMLGCIQKYKLNWTAWSFHVGATPRVLADWNYTPTDFWGKFVKQALQGKPFEMRKMR